MRRFLSLTVAIIYLINIGCSSIKKTPPSDLKKEKGKIVAAVYPNGHIVKFADRKIPATNKKGKTYTRTVGALPNWETRRIEGTGIDGNPYSIPMDELLYVQVEHTDAVKSIFLTLGIIVLVLAAVVGIAVATSCPFVYSYDGEKYVLDAEPLAGVIAKGLERGDICRLEHLRPVDGTYRLLMRNEVEETQYLDELKLTVVDHPANTTVSADLTGTPHALAHTVPPLSVHDENGTDIRVFFAADDDLAWQTQMPVDESWRDLPRRHELNFEFPRPATGSGAKLVVKSATSTWGAEMVREMLELRGDALDDWYASVDSHGASMNELIEFNQREELYFLKLYVLVGSEWQFRAWVPGGGPVVPETRVIPLDLSGVQGDRVKIRLLPPRGYWSLDFLGLDDSNMPTPRITEVPLKRAVDHDGSVVTGTMSARDGRRLAMPRVGDEVTLEFDAPGPVPGSGRTVFLNTYGYYLAHIQAKGPEQKQLIRDILEHEGRIVDFSMERYMEYRARMLSRN